MTEPARLDALLSRLESEEWQAVTRDEVAWMLREMAEEIADLKASQGTLLATNKGLSAEQPAKEGWSEWTLTRQVVRNGVLHVQYERSALPSADPRQSERRVGQRRVKFTDLPNVHERRERPDRRKPTERTSEDKP